MSRNEFNKKFESVLKTMKEYWVTDLFTQRAAVRTLVVEIKVPPQNDR